MVYDEELDEEVSGIVTQWGTTRKKMFGGTCYLTSGNVMCGVHKDFLILRLGKSGAEEALSQPHAVPFDTTGKPMKGWVMIDKAGLQGNAFRKWLEKAKLFAESLPPK